MAIKAIILDCDGVIMKSNHAYEQLYMKICRKYGLRKKAKDIYPLFGENPKRVLQELFGRKNIGTVYGEYNSRMKDADFLRKIKMYKGAKKAIRDLGRKYVLAVASGATKTRLRSSLRHCRISGYFDFILSGEEIRRGKPNPDIINKCVRMLHARKNEVIYVGDAPADALAAKRAGVAFIAVLTGILDTKVAKKLKADYIVRDITRIEGLVDKINKSAAG